MRLFVLVGCGALVTPTAAAESLQIQGVTGFLSEYELSASVSGQSSNWGTEELSGLLNVKHVGLCTHDGPNEMLGQLTIQFGCWGDDLHRQSEPAGKTLGKIGDWIGSRA
jgi:hypothetical protein